MLTQSASHSEYGESVLGVIFYDRKGLDSIERSFQTGVEIDKQRIRINSPCRELGEEKRGDLRYRGISVDDIEAVSFLPHVKETEKYETGEKKIPNKT
ncbi:MAG: hypothetical protein MIO92_16275, partial [Methanosarcinaceae archaeon]|nr:hypothetical protein [Methanosarcinaceae archaeon]